MKKNFIYSLAATFITAALALGSFTACSEDLVAEKQNTTVKEAPVCYFNIPASFADGAETRAVTIGENTATSSFEASDKIYVYIERASNTPAFGYDANALTPLTISNINGNTCDLSGALKFYHKGSGSDYEAYTPEVGDKVHLLYNQNGNLDYPVYPYYNYYSMSGAKDGYVGMGYFYFWGASHFDFAEAVMKVTAVTGDAGSGYSLTLGKVDEPTDTQVSFKSLQSMFRQRLSFTDEGGDPATPTITKFRVSSTNNKIVYSYYPFYDNNTQRYEYQPLVIGNPYSNPAISGDGDIYFPLMFNDENKNDALIFTAYDDAENVYTVTKNAPASGFANGKYYYGSAALAWHHNMRPTVTGTTAVPSNGTYTIDDNPVNITISGYSEDYNFEISEGHGGTITLDNVTATYSSSSEFISQKYTDPAGGISLVLTGTNSIYCRSFWGILVYGNLKLSCTGASATLTVTITDDGSCGIKGANYTPGSLPFDPSYNFWGTTTELDVTSQLAAPGFTVTRSARTDGPDADSDGNPDYYTWTYTVMPGTKIVNLNTLTENYTAQDGDILTGTLASNLKLKIAAGATVTLAGMTHHAGDYINSIECLGTANIILAEGTTNDLTRGSSDAYAGLFLNNGITGSTLTISGTGTLLASGGNACAGIGGINYCNDIVINGGIIYATGGQFAPGIGAGANVGQTGNITINGGNITATGGEGAAGIGAGCNSSECKDITIENTVTSVTAIKGAGASESIGRGSGGNSCGTVKFGTATMFDDSRWTTTPNSGNNYGLLHFVISKTTNPNDTWTLTPLNQGQGGLQNYNVNPANEQ